MIKGIIKGNDKLIQEIYEVSEEQQASELGMVRFDICASYLSNTGKIKCKYDPGFEVYFGTLPNEEFNKKYPEFMEFEQEHAIIVDVTLIINKEGGIPNYYTITKVKGRSGKIVLDGYEFFTAKDMKNHIYQHYSNLMNDVVPTGNNWNDIVHLMAILGKVYTPRYELYEKNIIKPGEYYTQVLNR